MNDYNKFNGIKNCIWLLQKPYILSIEPNNDQFGFNFSNFFYLFFDI